MRVADFGNAGVRMGCIHLEALAGNPVHSRKEPPGCTGWALVKYLYPTGLPNSQPMESVALPEKVC